MKISKIKKLTSYPDVNGVLLMMTQGIADIIGKKLVGLYLTGSLTYGDFNPGSSDIDFLVMIRQPLTRKELKKLTRMHEKIGRAYPKWSKRIECSYVTTAMLTEAPPPKKPKRPRPYFNFGKFSKPNARYGNEWTINLHVLYAKGVALIGPSPRKIIKRVKIEAVRKASRLDFYEDRFPKLNDPGYFKNSHYQAYLILSLCRILYRESHNNVASKKVASTWAKRELGEPWRSLIQKAESWHHGVKLKANTTKQTKAFIQFVASKIK